MVPFICKTATRVREQETNLGEIQWDSELQVNVIVDDNKRTPVMLQSSALTKTMTITEAKEAQDTDPSHNEAVLEFAEAATKTYTCTRKESPDFMRDIEAVNACFQSAVTKTKTSHNREQPDASPF